MGLFRFSVSFSFCKGEDGDDDDDDGGRRREGERRFRSSRSLRVRSRAGMCRAASASVRGVRGAGGRARS